VASIDVVDSIRINAQPEDVYAVIADYANITAWLPIYRCTLRNTDCIAEGVEVEHRYGYPPFVLSSFTRRIDAMVAGKRLEESYIDGAMLGTGIWNFEAEGDQTIASYHCKVEANNLMTKVVFTLNGAKAHSNTYQTLLKALQRHCEST
jgi:uncharacterized protein YndB with AHSA1/START domain